MASAVAQQATATQEISENAQLTADSSRIVAANVLDMEKKVRQHDRASNESLKEAKYPLDCAATLKEQADNFLRHVCAA